MLLLRRFDLRLGLWDLALNPVLRATVLDATPLEAPPNAPALPPPVARRRAERRAEQATSRRDSARHATEMVIKTLHRQLSSVGWIVDADGHLCRPLTEPLSNWPDSPKGPLVQLRTDVAKGSTRVVVWHWFYNDLDIRQFIERKRAVFDAVAPLGPPSDNPSSAVLSSITSGWGDAYADWSSIANAIGDRTGPWADLLSEFVASCRAIRRARFARHRD